jgi:1-acyl-sn-glycerol-3-phosphate acyltransferase
MNKTIKQYCIIIKSIASILAASTKIIFFSLINTLTRTKTNNISNKMGKSLLKAADISYSVHDVANIIYHAGRSFIIMSNHASLYDIPIIFATIPGNVRMITKLELRKVPIWGKAMEISEFIFIDRKNPRQAIKDLERAKEKMALGIVPWVSPEGTRSRDGNLQQFKRGAFLLAMKAQAIIIPVTIVGSYNVLKPKTLDFKLGQQIDIYVHQPIDSTQYQNNDVEGLLGAVRTAISSKLVNND